MQFIKVMAVLLVSCFLWTGVYAKEPAWKGGSNLGPNSWSISENWSNGELPSSNDSVYIDDHSSYSPVIYDYTEPLSLLNLQMDANELLIPDTVNSVTLSSDTEYIGKLWQGKITQNGGNHNARYLYLGLSNTANGEYNLNNGALDVTVAEYVGQLGKGTFNQKGGVNNAVSLFINNSASSYNMAGGSLNVGEAVNNGLFNVNGGSEQSPIVVSGNVTNNNEVAVSNSVVKFEGSFQNNGYFHSDPSVITFTDLTVGTEGYITAETGDEYHIAGNFLNNSTQNKLWDTGDANLVFGGGDHTFGLAGADLGANGYSNNFAWASLDLTAINKLVLEDGNEDNNGTAFYAHKWLGLQIDDGVIDNIYGNGFNLYYDASLAENSYLGGGTFTLMNGGQIIPTVTPEPLSTALFLLGAVPLGLIIKRRKQAS